MSDLPGKLRAKANKIQSQPIIGQDVYQLATMRDVEALEAAVMLREAADEIERLESLDLIANATIRAKAAEAEVKRLRAVLENIEATAHNRARSITVMKARAALSGETRE